MTILMVTVDGMGEANCEVLKVLTNSNYTQENQNYLEMWIIFSSLKMCVLNWNLQSCLD